MSDNNGSAGGGQPGAGGAGNDGGAGGGNGGGAGGGQGGAGGGGERWYSSAAEDLRGFAELKGWDTPDKALESYRNLEKFQGVPADRLAKVPDKEDAEGWSEFNKRFGWAPPATAAEYDIAVPEGQSDAFANAMRDVFHKAGVPAPMAKALIEGNNAYWAEQAKADEKAMETANTNAMTALKTEWGSNFDQLSQLADRARAELAPKMGLDEAQLSLLTDVFGPAGTLKMFAGLGGAIGESKFRSGDSSTLGPMTPDAAAARRDQLINDQEWQKRLQAGDVRARQEWDQINETLAHAAASSGRIR